MVSYNHLNKFDNRLTCLGGELDVVCVELIFQLVVGAVIFRSFRRTQVLCVRFSRFFYLFWFFGDLILY
jgi:hypothetical protein